MRCNGCEVRPRGPAVRHLRAAEVNRSVCARSTQCVACQQAQPGHTDRLGTRHHPHAALRARAQHQALRRLGLEHLDAYRALYRAERRAIPDTVPTAGPASRRSAARSGHCSDSTTPAMTSCTSRSSGKLSHNPIRDGPADQRTPQIPHDHAQAVSTRQRDGVGGRQSGQQGREPDSGQPGNAPPICSPRDGAVLGRSPTRCRQADRGQLARPLAKRWDGSVAEPQPQPPSRDSKQEAADD